MNSYQPKSLLNELQYYITPPHDCSYLANKTARMVFLDPTHKIDVVTLSELSRVGFRRSGDFTYRPECHLCRQCISSRVPAQEFKMNSIQKKAWKKNQDLTINIISTNEATDEHYELYERYICERHSDGDMFPPTHEQFEKFLVISCTDSIFIEFRLNNKLIAVSTCDQLDDGLSAVYTFFDPSESKRSLGTFAILKQIEYVCNLGLQYLYLGYWVPHSNKMNYKSQFIPLDLMLDGQWRRLNRTLTEDEIQNLGNSLMSILPTGWNHSIIK